MKRVLKLFAKLDVGLYGILFLKALLEAIDGYGVLLISSVMLNMLVTAESFSVVLRGLLLMAAAYALIHWFKSFLDQQQQYRTVRLGYRYRVYIMEQILSVPFSHLEDEDFNRVLDKIRLNTDIYGLTTQIINKVGAILGFGFQLLIALISFINMVSTVQSLGNQSFLAAVLLLVIFVLMVLSVGYSIWKGKQIAKAVTRMTDGIVEENAVSSHLINIISNYNNGKYIRLYRMQGRLLQEQQRYTENFVNFDIARSIEEDKPQVVCNVSSVLISGLVYFIVSVMALAGALGVGSIIWYAGTIQRFLTAIRQLIFHITRLNNDCKRQAVMFDLIDVPKETMWPSSEEGEKQSDMEWNAPHVLEFEHVSFAYPDTDRLVLKDVNLQISGLQRIALVGRNGSGKTTLIKLICRLYEPTEGRILLDGVDIRDIPIGEYRRALSVVFQDFEIFASTLGENIAMAADSDEQRLQAVMDKIDLSYRDSSLPLRRNLVDNGVEVSGGEGQKIAIGRALYKDAPMAILDEPTAALDPISESEIYEKFNLLVDGKIAIFISHRLSSCRFCDRILVLQDGELVQDGTHEALVANDDGLYAAMWNAQKQYYV